VGCVFTWDGTKSLLAPYAPLDFSGVTNGQILSADVVHKKIVPIVPVYSNDSSLKSLLIDPLTNIPYIRNRLIDGGGLNIYNDSVRRLGGTLDYAADFRSHTGELYALQWCYK
jgi:hypothetical protein